MAFLLPNGACITTESHEIELAEHVRVYGVSRIEQAQLCISQNLLCTCNDVVYISIYIGRLDSVGANEGNALRKLDQVASSSIKGTYFVNP